MERKNDGLDVGGLLHPVAPPAAESPQKQPGLERCQRLIQEICASLIQKSIDYKPEVTVERLARYVGDVAGDTPQRLLYSEISHFIFSLGLDARGDYVSNLDKLISYIDGLPQERRTCREYAIKLYDHSQLAIYQTENAANVLQAQIEEIEHRFQKDLKALEREYITILGIFASIVTAFFGAFAFSSSTLSNMVGVSIWRLLAVIDMLAFVLTNIIYLLASFILKVNNIKLEGFNIKKLSIIYLFVTVTIAAGWLFNAQRIPEFLLELLPWG